MATREATIPQPQTQIPPAERLMQLAGGYVLSAAVYTAATLRIADLLRDRPRPVSELASASGSNEDSLYRVLRMLVTFGIFQEPSPRVFAQSPLSEPLLADAPGSLRDMVLWTADGLHFRVWAELPEVVRTGRTAADLLFGKPVFEAMGEMPEVARTFNAAMTAVSSRLVPAVLDAYDFSGINMLMDVAGGHGYSICEILQRYPAMRGILFDLPSVVEHADCRVCALRLGDRCLHLAGSFFDRIPEGADAYYMQHIIHDWDDDQALKILANCRRALQGNPEGRLLVVDHVLPENSAPHPGKLLDLQMMVLPGGRERTEPELRRLFEKGGFRITQIAPTRVGESVVEARIA
jgi:hypothetical protein